MRPTCAYDRHGRCQQPPSTGLLVLDDAERAANHFNLLTITDANQRTFYGALPLPESETADIVIDGVDAFLRLYGTGTTAR